MRYLFRRVIEIPEILFFFSYLILLLKEHGWGFGSLKLDCPICHNLLTKEDWYPWVRDEVVEAYSKAKQLKSQLGKFCKLCGYKQLYKSEPRRLRGTRQRLKRKRM